MLTVPRFVSCNLKWFILLLLVGQNFHVHTKRNSRSNFSKRVWMVINNPSFVFARQNYCIQQNCFRAENGKNRDQMSCLEQLKLSAVEGSQWLLTAHQTLSHTNTHQPGVICHLTPNKMNVAPSVEAHSVLLEQKTEFSFSSFFFSNPLVWWQRATALKVILLLWIYGVNQVPHVMAKTQFSSLLILEKMLI